MRSILVAAIALAGMGITGCVTDGDDDRPVVIEKESPPQVIHHEREVVRERPVVVEKRSDPVVIEKRSDPIVIEKQTTTPAPPPKVEVNVDR